MAKSTRARSRKAKRRQVVATLKERAAAAIEERYQEMMDRLGPSAEIAPIDPDTTKIMTKKQKILLKRKTDKFGRHKKYYNKHRRGGRMR